MHSFKLFLIRWREALDRLFGLPNYERYRAHMQTQHPNEVPLDRRAFYDQAQQQRYGRGSKNTRCC